MKTLGKGQLSEVPAEQIPSKTGNEGQVSSYCFRHSILIVHEINHSSDGFQKHV